MAGQTADRAAHAQPADQPVTRLVPAPIAFGAICPYNIQPGHENYTGRQHSAGKGIADADTVSLQELPELGSRWTRSTRAARPSAPSARRSTTSPGLRPARKPRQLTQDAALSAGPTPPGDTGQIVGTPTEPASPEPPEVPASKPLKQQDLSAHARHAGLRSDQERFDAERAGLPPQSPLQARLTRLGKMGLAAQSCPSY